MQGCTAPQHLQHLTKHLRLQDIHGSRCNYALCCRYSHYSNTVCKARINVWGSGCTAAQHLRESHE
jgi:hypothetical protein